MHLCTRAAELGTGVCGQWKRPKKRKKTKKKWTKRQYHAGTASSRPFESERAHERAERALASARAAPGKRRGIGSERTAASREKELETIVPLGTILSSPFVTERAGGKAACVHLCTRAAKSGTRACGQRKRGQRTEKTTKKGGRGSTVQVLPLLAHSRANGRTRGPSVRSQAHARPPEREGV